MNVMCLTWAFFFAYFYVRGCHVAASRICVGQFIVFITLNVLMRKSQDFLALMTIYLCCSGVGIFSVAMSDPKLASTIYFFPVSILVASNLFGIKQAAIWFAVSLLHTLVYFYFRFGFTEMFTSELDALMLSLGGSFCVFFCCQQAEVSYQSKTKGLIKLSKHLQTRSDELEELATTDSLTGLMNRYQFQIELKKTLKVATPSEKVVLFLIDMDGFKDINDTLGHATGDEVLIAIGNRLKLAIGDRACVARLGGDEFCILIQGIANPSEADDIARQLFDVLVGRYYLKDVEVTLGTSVGYALCPDHSMNHVNILSFADTAMYHAKNNQLQFASYQSEMTDELRTHRQMNEQLAIALENDELYLDYQPQFNAKKNIIYGTEALLRWRPDGGSTVSPTDFIPLLESTGRILPVSKWVIHEACRQQAEWKTRGLDVSMAVNISALQFKDVDFVDSVIRPIEKFNISPQKIELEITEGILVENVDQVTSKLMQLKNLGCRISIDDFGTGYSSLAYLRQFPLDKLKIDRAFVKDIPLQDDGVIASGIVMLAELLKLDVIAEGIETDEQLDFLRKIGCVQYQGYLFGKPVSPDAFYTMAAKSQGVVTANAPVALS